MRLSEIGELSLIETIRKRFSQRSKGIVVGIGDDAAVIKSQGKNLLVTTDMMVEGIHFDIKYTTPYQLGFKLVSVNVSDIYAMGGRPRYLLLDISMNRNTEEAFIDRFFDGVYDSMRFYNISLIGGDISSSKREMSVAATLIGYAENPVRRSGARPGDRIYVTGNLGDSACGLEVLKRIREPIYLEDMGQEISSKQSVKKEKKKIRRWEDKNGLTLDVVKPLLKRHLMPVARDPKSFIKHITAMIDISDGLFIDLSRLCDESKVGAKVYMNHIPISPQMKKTSGMLRIDPLKLATSGGEDYELLFIAPSTAPIPSLLRKGAGEVKITCIGQITEKGRVVVDARGNELKFKTEGYQHFGSKR